MKNPLGWHPRAFAIQSKLVWAPTTLPPWATLNLSQPSQPAVPSPFIPSTRKASSHFSTWQVPHGASQQFQSFVPEHSSSPLYPGKHSTGSFSGVLHPPEGCATHQDQRQWLINLHMSITEANFVTSYTGGPSKNSTLAVIQLRV